MWGGAVGGRYADGFGERLVELTTFVQEPLSVSQEWSDVRDLANRLLTILNEPAMLTLILAANRPGGSALSVQARVPYPR